MAQPLLAWAATVPRATQAYAAAGLVCSTLSAVSETVASLLQASSTSLLPPRFRVWTLVTAGFAESSLFLALLELALLVPAAAYLERRWGMDGFIKFAAVVHVGSAVAAAIYLLFAFVVSGDLDTLYYTHVGGMLPMLLGMSVAFKQLVPEHALPAPGVTLRAKDVPLLSVAATATLLALLDGLPSAVYATAGWYTAWVYLRFYQVHDGSRGDRNETFAFVTFFPDRVQPAVRVLSTATFRTLVTLRLCERIERTEAELEEGRLAAKTRTAASPLGNEQLDAERRRQKALQALNSRLAIAEHRQAAPPAAAPPAGSADGADGTAGAGSPAAAPAAADKVVTM